MKAKCIGVMKKVFTNWAMLDVTLEGSGSCWYK